ncbi:hypothetical protein [Polymorphobacter sp.]|uniref:hypothetical protein n=1 Tax=Polymorphobacter sp. TaxID=1909290 RepID=UPI003F71FFF5
MSELPLPRLGPMPLPIQRELALQRPGWPMPLARVESQPDIDATARRFEAMIVEQLLASSRKASLAGSDNPLTGGGDLLAGQDIVHEQIDRTRAELIARAAPLGIARLLKEDPR